MTFRGCFPLFSKNEANFLRLVTFDGYNNWSWWNLYIENKHYNAILLMQLLVSKFHFLEFWLLLSLVTPYYTSLPWTVWYHMLCRSFLGDSLWCLLLISNSHQTTTVLFECMTTMLTHRIQNLFQTSFQGNKIISVSIGSTKHKQNGPKKLLTPWISCLCQYSHP